MKKIKFLVVFVVVCTFVSLCISANAFEITDTKLYAEGNDEEVSSETDNGSTSCTTHEETEEMIEEPTCSKTGYSIKKCKICGVQLSIKLISKTEHAWGDWVVDKESSCSEAGHRSRTCSACNEKEEKQTEKLSHKFSKWEITKEVTCTEDGEQQRICSLCSHTEKETIEKGHDWGDWETPEVYTEPYPTQSRTCSVCENTESQSVADNNNSQSSAIEVKFKDVLVITGTLKNSDDIDWYKVNLPCAKVSKAELTLESKTSIYNSLGEYWLYGPQKSEPVECKITMHKLIKPNMDYHSASFMTPINTSTKLKFTAWNELPYESKNGMNEHSPEINTKGINYISIDPSGVFNSSMNGCKYTLTIYFEHAHYGNSNTYSGHASYYNTEWKTVKTPTCLETGSQELVCSICGYNFTRGYNADGSPYAQMTNTIKKASHTFSEWEITKEPSKVQQGTETRYCKVCKLEEKRDLELEHGEYGEWKITKEATCEYSGEKSFICYCCDKATKTQTISKLEHKYNSWAEILKALPERNGNSQRTCSLCGKKEERVDKYNFLDIKNRAKIYPNFKDVNSSAWYKDVVDNCYNYSLMMGDSENTFNPMGNITLAEVITTAVRIWCLNNPDDAKPTIGSSPWYQCYVDFAIEKKIINKNDFKDYTVPATRAEMAYILKNSVSSTNLAKLNDINSIPDVTKTDKYGEEIFKLYEAGILGGSDEKGTFYPNKNITRAEGAAIIARLSKISDRIKK